MAPSSSIQKRRTTTIASTSTSPHSVDGGLNVPVGADGAGTTTGGNARGVRQAPRQRSKKRRQQQNAATTRTICLRSLINLGLFALAAVVGWKLVGAARDFLRNEGAAPRQLTEEEEKVEWKPTIPTTFQLLSEAAPTCHELSPDQVDFTLVTQLSQDRLWMMKHHCERFPHAISIAVYSNATLSETWDELQEMGCDLTLVTATVIDARRVGSPEDYPVNILRNAALEKVKTTHIIYVDVDFWLSKGLYDILQSENIVQSLVDDPKLTLVLPAFMLFRQCMDVVDCRDNNIPLMPQSRRDILSMMVEKRGHIFDPTNRGGHGSTLYSQWIRQDEATLVEIPCLQSHRYEPFIVVRLCRDLPPFPAPFTGYGKNKLAWMMHLIRKGYKLSQVGGAFVVHYPHLESAARVKWNEAPKTLQVHQKRNVIRIRTPKKSDGNLNLHSYKRGQVDELFVAFRKWLEEEVTDSSRVDMCTNAQDDDSKLWIDKTTSSTDETTTTTDKTKKKMTSVDHQAKQDAKAAAIQKDNFRIEQEAAAAAAAAKNSLDAEDGEENQQDDRGGADDSQDGDGEGNPSAETGESGDGEIHSQQEGEAET